MPAFIFAVKSEQAPLSYYIANMSDSKKPYTILYTTAQSEMMGGGQWSLYYLIARLDKKKYAPIVACPEEGELAEKMRQAGAKVVCYAASRLRSLSIGDVLYLKKIIQNHSVSLVHTDSSTETFYAGIAAKLCNIPLVWHIRVSDKEPFIDRFFPSFCSKLILVASALSERFSCSESKLRVIHNGYDPSLMDNAPLVQPSIRIQFGLAKNAILLGCFGRVEKRKGAHILCETLQKVPEAYLLLAGKEEESYASFLRDLFHQEGVLSRVIFAGQREDAASLMKQIDIFCFPVLWGEGFSRALLEAMAAEKVVVASSDAGNKEAVIEGETGYIVPVGDANLFAERVKTLSSSQKLRDAMGKAGRKRLEEEFTLQKTAEKIDILYSALLS